MIYKAHKRPGNKSIIVECDFSLPLLLFTAFCTYISLVEFNIEKLDSKAFRDGNVLHSNLDRERLGRKQRNTHTSREKEIAVVSP